MCTDAVWSRPKHLSTWIGWSWDTESKYLNSLFILTLQILDLPTHIFKLVLFLFHHLATIVANYNSKFPPSPPPHHHHHRLFFSLPLTTRLEQILN